MCEPVGVLEGERQQLHPYVKALFNCYSLLLCNLAQFSNNVYVLLLHIVE